MDYEEFKNAFDGLQAQIQGFVDAWFEKPLTVSKQNWHKQYVFFNLDQIFEEAQASHKSCVSADGLSVTITLQKDVQIKDQWFVVIKPQHSHNQIISV